MFLSPRPSKINKHILGRGFKEIIMKILKFNFFKKVQHIQFLLKQKGTTVQENRPLNQKILICALVGVGQWTECHPANQRVARSIPSRGTCLGCGPGSRLGMRERQPHIDVSPPLFPPLFLFL